MEADWSLADVLKPPVEGNLVFGGGLMSTFSVEPDFVRKGVWPLLYGELAESELLRRSREAAVILVADRASAQDQIVDLGGWTVLAPREGRQHSKIWLLRFVDRHSAKTSLFRLAIGSHNLTLASFTGHLETSFWDEIDLAKDPESDYLDWYEVFHDALAYMAHLVDECSSTGSGECPPVDLARDFVRSLKKDLSRWFPSSRKKNRMRGRDIVFLGSNVPRRPLIDSLRRKIAVMGSHSDKAVEPDRVVFFSPFLDRGTSEFSSITALDQLAFGANAVQFIGRVGSWETNVATQSWLRDKAKDGGLVVSFAADKKGDSTRTLHAKGAAWQYGKDGLLYVGSANLTHRGFLLSPPVGNHEAGILMRDSWREINGWIQSQLKPRIVEWDDVKIEIAEEKDHEVVRPPSPLQWVLCSSCGQDYVLQPIWLTAVPISGSLMTLAEETLLHDISLKDRFLVRSIPDRYLRFRSKEDGMAWNVPVVAKDGSPFMELRDSYEAMLECYRRGLSFSVPSALPDEENEEDLYLDSGEGFPQTLQGGCPDVGPRTYEIRRRAEEIHLILEHIRRLPSYSIEEWYRMDLLALLRMTVKRRLGGRLAVEFWRVASQESNPVDMDRRKIWKKAVKSVENHVLSILGAAETGGEIGE